MPRHIVCLTFDFDTESGFIARGLATPTMLSRGEFGLTGARRILDLAKSRGIPMTWFIPGFTITFAHQPPNPSLVASLERCPHARTVSCACWLAV